MQLHSETASPKVAGCLPVLWILTSLVVRSCVSLLLQTQALLTKRVMRSWPWEREGRDVKGSEGESSAHCRPPTGPLCGRTDPTILLLGCVYNMTNSHSDFLAYSTMKAHIMVVYLLDWWICTLYSTSFFFLTLQWSLFYKWVFQLLRTQIQKMATLLVCSTPVLWMFHLIDVCNSVPLVWRCKTMPVLLGG